MKLISLFSLRVLLSFVGLWILAGALAYSSVDTDSVRKVPLPLMMETTIWKRFDLADFTLHGEVRSPSTKQRYPLTLRTRGHQLVYEFTDPPLQIRMIVGQEGTIVQKRKSASDTWTDVAGKDRGERILNTDVTYEDLSLDFLNWDDIKPIGTDSIKTLPAFVYDAVPAASDSSPYTKVRFWVSSEFWALLRVDAYNAQNQVGKIVEVQDVLTIKDYTVFKQMRIATIVPGTNDVSSSTTYIQIFDGQEGSGLPPGNSADAAPHSGPVATGSSVPPGPVQTDKVDLGGN